MRTENHHNEEQKKLVFSIRIPGRIYDVLVERDAFTSESEKETLAAFNGAVPKKAGRGTTWTIEGDDRPLREILEYVYSLYQLTHGGIIPASELGGGAKTLQDVADQAIQERQSS
jgi:hypothetical protein